jgi:hypothetical protein
VKLPERTFEATPAVRREVPVLVGLTGASGSGKTFSAFRLATGIQQVRGGDIYVLDTEANRALHYADDFKFHHVPFKPPFGSLDYLAALRFIEKKKPGVIVVDSMSHEHEGEGGYLLTQEAEMTRMAGEDWQKRERVKFAAWIKPAAERRALINGILQMNTAFIFCFRAKEKTKPVPGSKPMELGFMPIAGEEFVYEMVINALLMPRAGGVPTWKSEKVGESMMMKLPKQFAELFTKPLPMSEQHGVAIAEWARGNANAPTAPTTQTTAKTLSERAAAARQAIKAAKTSDDLKKLWKAAQRLRADLAADDRITLAELEKQHDAREAELAEAGQ